MSTSRRRPARESPLPVILSIAGLALAFGLGEAAIRVVSSRRLIYNIEMLRYARELKMPDPSGELTHVHRPNAAARLMGVDVRLNSLGHRGRELPPAKAPSTKRVLVLGGSVTMGWGVPERQVFTSLVEERLNREKPFGPRIDFEFANAGVGNYDTHSEAVLFLRQYRRVQPDLVVLQFFPQDVEPRAARDNALLRRSYLAAYLFNCLSVAKFALTGRGDLFDYYRGFYAGEPWSRTLSDLRRLRDVAAREKIPLVIMALPDPRDLSPDSPFRGLLGNAARAFRALGIETLDSFDEFSRAFHGRAGELWLAPDDPHYNARGHELMADILYRYIAQQDPLGLRRRARRAA